MSCILKLRSNRMQFVFLLLLHLSLQWSSLQGDDFLPASVLKISLGLVSTPATESSLVKITVATLN